MHFGHLYIRDQFWATSARVKAIRHAVAQGCRKRQLGWARWASLSKSWAGTEASLSRGEQRHVGEVRKRKFCVPRFVAHYSQSIPAQSLMSTATRCYFTSNTPADWNNLRRYAVLGEPSTPHRGFRISRLTDMAGRFTNPWFWLRRQQSLTCTPHFSLTRSHC